MPQEQKQAYCEQCGEHRLFLQTTPHHLIHGALTVFTCFAWGIVWAIVTFTHDYRWRCSTCGSYPGLTAQEKKRQATTQSAVLAITLGGLIVVLVFGLVYFFRYQAQT